jgi:TolB-like protein/Tfp pilus assembly protein PilF
MNAVGSAEIFEFADFRFHLQDLSLWRLERERPVEVGLGGRAREVLVMLLEAHPAMVERRKLLKLWPDNVAPNNLDIQIRRLRKRIDPNGCIINTVYAEGFRIGVPVKRVKNALTPPRLSIVVLPFVDLSEDQKYQYFADAIADDLTTDLSRIEGMFVISWRTASTYRNRSVDPKQVGQELQVRYALQGSVQRSGNRARVNTQLIHAETRATLWAEWFDRDADKLFELQDEITSRIAIALNAELVNAEATRPTEHPDALDYIFRARAAAWGKLPSNENYTEAIGLFERALALDPQSVEAQSWLASVLANRALEYPCADSRSDLKRAEELATKAVAASPRSPRAHFAKAQVLRLQNRCDEAIAEFETVLALNRNWFGAIFGIAWCKFHIGAIDEVIPLLEQVIRLSPRDPYLGISYARIGIVHLLQSRTDEAIVWLEQARNAIPARPFTRATLASAYALNGDAERAAAELAEAQRLGRDGRYSSIAGLRTVGHFGVPKIRALYEATYFAGLRKAGVPEE